MYRFTSTRKSPRTDFSGVRVCNPEGVRVVEYRLDQYDPLGYLRRRNGKHRKAFIEQCIAAGVPQSEIDATFSDSHPNHGV